jgi:hypothetical protein
MATITATLISHTEIAFPTGVAAAVAGDQVLNDGRVFLRFENSGTERTVTIPYVAACSDGTTHSVVVTVPASTGDVLVGPFPSVKFNSATGHVAWTYDAETALTVTAFKLHATGV